MALNDGFFWAGSRLAQNNEGSCLRKNAGFANIITGFPGVGNFRRIIGWLTPRVNQALSAHGFFKWLAA